MTVSRRKRAVSPTLSPARDDELLTTSELAAMLKRAPDTLRQWRYLGVGPRPCPRNDAGAIYYLRSEVDRWIVEGDQ